MEKYYIPKITLDLVLEPSAINKEKQIKNWKEKSGTPVAYNLMVWGINTKSFQLYKQYPPVRK